MTADSSYAAAAHSNLEKAGRALMDEGVRLYGLSQNVIERDLPGVLANDAGAFLFDRTIELTAVPSLFAQSRTILELGCGSAPFIYTALARGHVAVGIDNDEKRLAVAHAKIQAYGLNPAWQDAVRLGDATDLDFEANSFELVLGWQVIEHIPNLNAALYEAVRVTRPGGFLVFWAPDYRAPYEAHYEMPWPPFANRRDAERWVEAMGRPAGGIGTFFNITLYQVYGILEALGCRILEAKIDRALDSRDSSYFDLSSSGSLRRCAAAMLEGQRAATLPDRFRTPTSLMIAAQKL